MREYKIWRCDTCGKEFYVPMFRRMLRRRGIPDITHIRDHFRTCPNGVLIVVKQQGVLGL
jgi:hypothetical protein